MSLFAAFEAFPEVAQPIIIKSDMLRLGMRFGDQAREAFRSRDDITYKGFHLFTYDREQPVMFGERIPVVIYPRVPVALTTDLFPTFFYVIDISRSFCNNELPYAAHRAVCILSVALLLGRVRWVISNCRELSGQADERTSTL